MVILLSLQPLFFILLFADKPMSRKTSIESRPDSIPPLIDRLAAARVIYSNDDMMVGNKESPPSQSPLTGSGEHIVGSPKTSLSSFTDR